MELSKQECRELRRETSLLGQQNNLSDIYGDYMPEEMSIQQALQEGLSIVSSPKTLNFQHNREIYIPPHLEEDDATTYN